LDIVVESPPKDAVWIDLRESTEDKIDYPTLKLQTSELSEYPNQLKQNQNYLLFCNGGMKSAKIAHELQEKGYQTYAYAGGISRLKKYILSLRKNPTNTHS
jgi:rhodanese-related sulfurtransferase